jgi:hypothetical protein
MNKFMLLLLILMLSSVIFAQDVSWQYAASVEGTGQDEAWAVTVDNQGNRYVTGFHSLDITFGSFFLPGNGINNIFVAKQSPDGTWLWALNNTGYGNGRGTDIAVDNEGYVYVCGYFEDLTVFGDAILLNSAGGMDGFILRLYPTGSPVWVAQVGGPLRDECIGVDVDSLGYVYATGYFESTSWFSTDYDMFSRTSTGERDVFITKIEPWGVFDWITQAGGPNDDIGMSVAIDASGNSYVTGTFWGNPTFGTTTTLTNTGYWDSFVAKVSPTGNWLWAKQSVSAASEWGYDIAVDGSANVYITGSYELDITLGTTILSTGGLINKNFYTAKLDTNGNWLWAVGAGGSGQDWAYSLAVDTGGNVYLTGNFDSTDAAFGSTVLISQGWADVFVAMLNTSGVWQWAVRAGGSGSEWSHSIALDTAGHMFVTGCFDGPVTFGSTALSNLGAYDIFIAQLSIYNPDEDWLWASRAGSGNSDICYATDTDGQGSQYVTGYFVDGSALRISLSPSLTPTATGSGLLWLADTVPTSLLTLS